MSNYLDRLESELLTAGRRRQARGAAPSARARRRVWRVTGIVPVILSLAVTGLVVAVVLSAGLIHGASHSTPGQRGHGAVKPGPTPVAPKVTASPACRLRGPRASLPPLVMSDSAPSAQLSSILSMAREPAPNDGTAAIRGFDRAPLNVLTVFRRFIRIVNGERGERVAFFPAVFCQQTDLGSAFPPTRIRITAEQGIMMLPLDRSPKTTAVTVSTASLIRTGFALPGLDSTNGQWIQGVIVPDGVAKVVMHFTPPFLHHYSATAVIQDNVGTVVRRPDYTPTTVSWYAADGHLMRTFVDKKDLRIDNCLAAHRKNCVS
jgi:hypothetical protein